MSRIVARVSEAIAALLSQFIEYPARMETLQAEFYNIAYFPGIVECIDCTHIAIRNSSPEQALLYVTRKGYYSINVQVVCDAQRRILDIVAKWRGSVHDARIWDSCSLKEEFEVSIILHNI